MSFNDNTNWSFENDNAEKQIDRLKQLYFLTDSASRATYKKGKHIVTQGALNDHLYLVLSGTVSGEFEIKNFLDTGESRSFEVFSGSKGTFVGVHSFFSDPHFSFFSVKAVTEVEVAILKRGTPPIEPETYGSLKEQFIPMISNELVNRNFHLLKTLISNEQTLNRLHRSELNASLGQLAAGIAHELNNAVGVISRKTDYISEALDKIIATKSPEMHSFFQKGFLYNAVESTEQIRKQSRQLENKWKLSTSKAKILSRILFSSPELEASTAALLENFSEKASYWELGRDMRDISLAANHSADIVKSVRTLGGSHVTREEGLSIYETLSRAIALLKPNLGNINLEVDLESIEKVPLIYGDMTEIVQIWVNIIKNACDAMMVAETKDASILIRSFYSEKEVSVHITDNGPGIPKEMVDKIYQSDFTTKKNGLSFGLGLGLTIVKRIVESYDGKIFLASRPQKTTFTVKLPIEKHYEKY